MNLFPVGLLFLFVTTTTSSSVFGRDKREQHQKYPLVNLAPESPPKQKWYSFLGVGPEQLSPLSSETFGSDLMKEINDSGIGKKEQRKIENKICKADLDCRSKLALGGDELSIPVHYKIFQFTNGISLSMSFYPMHCDNGLCQPGLREPATPEIRAKPEYQICKSDFECINPGEKCRNDHCVALTRIQDGDDAIEHAYPYIIGIIIKTPTEYYRCGGILISDSLILTAYHCLFYKLKMYPAIVVAGAVDITNTREPNQQRQHVTPASYQRLGDSEDVGLIKLTTPFELNQFVKVVKIKRDWTAVVGNDLDIIGWGQVAEDTWPQYLQAATLQVLDKTVDSDHCHTVEPSNTHLCLANKAKNQGACSGDSGGPAIAAGSSESPGEDYVVGIIVNGPEVCDLRSSAFADVLRATIICHFLDNVGLVEVCE